MSKDYLENIEKLDERDLPNVNINKERIEVIKSNVIETINGLKERNKLVDVNVTLEEALKIREKLGDNDDKRIFGITNSKLMREVIMKSIKEKEGLNEDNIVAELFRESYVIYSRGIADAGIYYKFFLTEKELIVYTFDREYKILSNYRTLIENLRAGKSGFLNSTLSSDEYFIELPNTKIIVYRRYGGPEEELLDFMEILKNAGVPEPSNGKMPIFKIVFMLMWIFFMLVYIINL